MSKKRAFAGTPVPPKFTDPGPAVLLADVPGMPAEAVAHFAAKGVRTLADLRPLVEARAAADAQCEPAFEVVGPNGLELPVLVRFKAGDALIGLLGGRAHMLKVMAGWPVAPASTPAVPADDFDEHTPPPRQRPKGDALGRYLELPPGEPVVELFHRWDGDGRIPPECVLAELTRDGYTLLAAAGVGLRKLTGRRILPEKLEAYRVRVTICQSAGRFPESPRQFAVLQPLRT